MLIVRFATGPCLIFDGVQIAEFPVKQGGSGNPGKPGGGNGNDKSGGGSGGKNGNGGIPPIDDDYIPGFYLKKPAPQLISPGPEYHPGQTGSKPNIDHPWIAVYYEFGRLIARTDYNAPNSSTGKIEPHYELWEYGPGRQVGEKIVKHGTGEWFGND